MIVSVSRKVPGEELLKSTVIVIWPPAGIVNGEDEVVNAEPVITATTFVMSIACLFSMVKLRILVAPALIDPKSKGEGCPLANCTPVVLVPAYTLMQPNPASKIDQLKLAMILALAATPLQ